MGQQSNTINPSYLRIETYFHEPNKQKKGAESVFLVQLRQLENMCVINLDEDLWTDLEQGFLHNLVRTSWILMDIRGLPDNKIQK